MLKRSQRFSFPYFFVALILIARYSAEGKITENDIKESLARMCKYGIQKHDYLKGNILGDSQAQVAKFQGVPKPFGKGGDASGTGDGQEGNGPVVLQNDALLAAIKVDGSREMCGKMLNPYLKTNSYDNVCALASSATILGVEWLVERLLDEFKPGGHKDAYLLLRRHLKDCSEAATSSIKSLIRGRKCKYIYDGVLRLILDVEKTGKLYELERLQAEFGIFDGSNIDIFTENGLLYMLEKLSYQVSDVIASFEWKSVHIKKMIRGCNVLVLQYIDIDSVKSAFFEVLRESGKENLFLVPTIVSIMERSTNFDEEGLMSSYAF